MSIGGGDAVTAAGRPGGLIAPGEARSNLRPIRTAIQVIQTYQLPSFLSAARPGFMNLNDESV
jgi:hypothetical protein